MPREAYSSPNLVLELAAARRSAPCTAQCRAYRPDELRGRLRPPLRVASLLAPRCVGPTRPDELRGRLRPPLRVAPHPCAYTFLFVRFRRRNEAPAKPRRRIRKLRFTLLLLILGLVCLASFGFGFITAIANDVPSLDPAKARKAERNGYIYAADGTVLAVLRSDQSRVLVGSNQIAPIMKQAIVAVEDRRFWEHQGVDLRGILRAVWSDISNKGVVQGGSTITQQLVKNTYIKPERTVSRKLKEAALAWQLERRWSKDRILTTYLNTIYFGHGAYGIEMAVARVLQAQRERADAPRGGSPRRHSRRTRRRTTRSPTRRVRSTVETPCSRSCSASS